VFSVVVVLQTDDELHSPAVEILYQYTLKYTRTHSNIYWKYRLWNIAEGIRANDMPCAPYSGDGPNTRMVILSVSHALLVMLVGHDTTLLVRLCWLFSGGHTPTEISWMLRYLPAGNALGSPHVE
jgi:hypothetical protein